jgi:hypothetical protein
MINSCLDCKYLETVSSEIDHNEPEPYCDKFEHFHNYYIILNEWFLEHPKHCNSFLNKENTKEND